MYYDRYIIIYISIPRKHDSISLYFASYSAHCAEENELDKEEDAGCGDSEVLCLLSSGAPSGNVSSGGSCSSLNNGILQDYSCIVYGHTVPSHPSHLHTGIITLHSSHTLIASHHSYPHTSHVTPLLPTPW